MRKLVILRPEPGASATFEAAAAAGLEPIKLPLFEIEPIAWTAPDAKDFDGILVTSANSLRENEDELAKLRSLPVYAVGPATAQAAREAEFTLAAVGRAGVREFLKSIDSDLRLFHLAGEDRIDYRLTWQKITPVTAYRAKQLAIADPGPLEGAVLMIHSPRAGRAIAALEFDKSRASIAAISRAAAEACGAGWAQCRAAGRPTDPALLALAARLCEKTVGR